MVIITQETKLTAEEVESLTTLLSDAYVNDPISRRLNGAEQKEEPNTWRIIFKDNILKGLKIGKLYTVRSNEGRFLACAVGFGPGVSVSDMPSMPERIELDSRFPDKQKAFRAEYEELHEALYAKVYPPNFKRDNLHILEFVVDVEHQRQGIGRKLISYIIKQTLPETKIVLDTSKWENVLFYQASGFDLKGSFDLVHWRFGPLPKMYTLSLCEKKSTEDVDEPLQ